MVGDASSVARPRATYSGEDLLVEAQLRVHRSTDRLFGRLLVVQWLLAIALALIISPYSWNGAERSLHVHVKLAVVLGGLINLLPLFLIRLRPGWRGTRHTIAVVQMAWSFLLILITGGRIETHFHVFGSLAVLALYRDWKVLLTATLIAAADYVVPGLLSPDSAFGFASPDWWRSLEHLSWLAFEEVFLVISCIRSVSDMRIAAQREVRSEAIVGRKVQERTLEVQDSLERYRSLVENTEAIQFEYDLGGRRLLYIAPQACRLLECTMGDLADETFLESIINANDRAQVYATALQCLAGDDFGGDPIDCRLTAKSGRAIYVRAFVRREGNRRIRGILLDVTRQRKLELESQQVKKLESVGRLAAGVAHEINTPIQFVGHSVEFARTAVEELLVVVEKQRVVVQGVLDETSCADLARAAADAFEAADVPYLVAELPSALERIDEGASRVTKIVRSLRVFSHPDSIEKAEVDLNEAIENTLALAHGEFRDIADVVTDYGKLPRVACHVGEVNQVILNILVNAAHAMADVASKTGRRGQVTVKTRIESGEVAIAISDTGGGIPEHVRDQIFDPFFTTKEIGKGTGQGLAIARSMIVDRHGGSLSFETVSGTGTTFHIKFPHRHLRSAA